MSAHATSKVSWHGRSARRRRRSRDALVAWLATVWLLRLLWRGWRAAVQMRFLGYLVVSWLANALVLAVVAWALTDVHRGTTGQWLGAAALFGVLNTVLKPILKLLTLPLAIVTLGVAWFGVSMLMLWITDALVSGFDVRGGFMTFVWATLIIWAVNLVLDLAAGVLRGGSGHGRALTAG